MQWSREVRHFHVSRSVCTLHVQLVALSAVGLGSFSIALCFQERVSGPCGAQVVHGRLKQTQQTTQQP